MLVINILLFAILHKLLYCSPGSFLRVLYTLLTYVNIVRTIILRNHILTILNKVVTLMQQMIQTLAWSSYKIQTDTSAYQQFRTSQVHNSFKGDGVRLCFRSSIIERSLNLCSQSEEAVTVTLLTALQIQHDNNMACLQYSCFIGLCFSVNNVYCPEQL